MIDWRIEATSWGNCNCDHCCPCQFELRPTHGGCEGFEAIHIDRGHFGDVDLSGLRAVLVFQWPGAIFEGNGVTQLVIDERADAEQRAALSTVLRGGETREAATHWWVFSTMSTTIHEDLFLPIEFEADIEARTGRVSVPGYLEAIGEPIRNPVDGGLHRVQIRCPEGIEFETAEVGNSTARVTGPIHIHNQDTYGQFNRLDHTGDGPAHVRA